MMEELINQVMKAYKINESEYRDACFAICLADRFVGSNRLELDMTKFAKKTLPEVQYARVACDALVYLTGGKRPYTMEATRKVVGNGEFQDYADIGVCERTLKALLDDCVDWTWLTDLEKEIDGYGFGGYADKAWSGVCVPCDSKHLRKGDVQSEVTREKLLSRLCPYIGRELRDKVYSFENMVISCMVASRLEKLGYVVYGDRHNGRNAIVDGKLNRCVNETGVWDLKAYKDMMSVAEKGV